MSIVKFTCICFLISCIFDQISGTIKIETNWKPLHRIGKRNAKLISSRLDVVQEATWKQLEAIESLKEFFWTTSDSGEGAVFRDGSVKQRKSKYIEEKIQLSTKMDKLQYLKKRTDRSMEDLVLISDNIPKIRGRKYLTNITSFENLNCKEAFTGKITGVGMVGTLMDNLVKLDDQRQIKAQKWINGEVSTQEFRPIFLNNRKLTKYVRDPDEVIEGAVFANGLEVSQSIDLSHNSSVFGQKVATDFWKLDDHINIDECIIKKLSKTDGSLLNVTQINGRRFLDILKTHMKSKHLMLTKYDIKNTITIKGDLRAARVMGLSSDELSSDMELKVGNHTIQTGVFHSMSANMNIPAFTEDNPDNPIPTKRSSVVKIHASKFRKLVVDDVVVRGNIGGRHSSELVNLDSDETIDADVHFKNGIKVVGNLISESQLIDGIIVNPSYTTSSPHNVAIHRGNISVVHLDVKGTINGYDFTKMSRDLVKNNGKVQEITAFKTIPNVTALSVNLEYLDNEPFSAYINLKKPAHIIRKTFASKVLFNDVLVTGTLNDKIPSEIFENKLHINRKYNLTEKSFTEVQCETLNIISKVNSIPSESFMSGKGLQSINFPVTIWHPVFKKIFIKELWTPTDSIFDKIQLKDSSFNEHVSSRFLEDIEVMKHVTVRSSLECNKLNNLETSSLLDVFRRNSELQHVTNLHPTKLIVTSDVISDPTMRSRVFSILNPDFTPIGSLRNWDKISAPSIDVNGKINGMDMRRFGFQAILPKDSLAYFSGKKTFSKGFTVAKDWEVKHINNKNFRTQGLTTNTYQNIHHPVEFDDISSKNLNINFFNGQRVPKRWTNSSQIVVIDGPLRVHGRPSTRTLNVQQNLNDLDIKEDEKDWVNLASSKNRLIGDIEFRGKARIQSLETVNINNKPREKWMPKLDSNTQPIAWNVTSSSEVHIKKVHSRRIENEEFNLFLRDLRNQRMRFTDIHRYNSKILQDVVVKGSLKFRNLNGRNIKEDYIHKEMDQVFPVPWSFCTVETSNLTLRTFWRGAPIPEFKLDNKTLIRLYESFPYDGTSLRITGNLTANISDTESGALVFVEGKVNPGEITVKGSLEAKETIYVSSLATPNSISGLSQIFGKPFLQIMEEARNGKLLSDDNKK